MMTIRRRIMVTLAPARLSVAVNQAEETSCQLHSVHAICSDGSDDYDDHCKFFFPIYLIDDPFYSYYA